MSVMDIILTFFITIGNLLIAPFKKPEMLWIIVPVYLNWLFTEFYQEKKGTSLGNAITNGFVALWVGIDWSRTTVNFVAQKTTKLVSATPKIMVAALMIGYGIAIIFFGIRGKKMVRFLGRIREVTYLTLMLTPLFYGVMTPTFGVVLSIIIFFPMFYGIVELVDHWLPTPSIYEINRGNGSETSAFGSSPDLPAIDSSFDPRTRELR